MTTSNDPVHYEYISKRLTTEIVQQHEASRPRRKATTSLKFGALSLGLEALRPDYVNRYDLVHRATEAIADLTGSLDSPGPYVSARMDLEISDVIIHLGFEKTGRQKVAGFFGDQEIPGVGRVFVALLGSVSNLTGWRAEDKLQTQRNPSDAAGMYEVLQTALEPSDARIDARYLQDESDARDPGMSFEAAYNLAFRGESKLSIVRDLEFLAVAHLIQSNVRISGIEYDVALLGAPVWVAMPRPQRLQLGS